MTDKMREALLGAKLGNIISGYRINPDDADWLRGLLAPPQHEQRGKIAYWAAADSDGNLQMTMSADDANGGMAARQEVNDWINEAIADGEPATHLVALYTAPPAPTVPDDVVKDAARFRWLITWMIRHGLLFRENCVPDHGMPLGSYVSLWPPFSIDRRNAPLGYGATEKAAIDAAMLAAAPEQPR